MRRHNKCKSGSRVCCVTTCDARDNHSLTFHQFPKRGQKVVLKNSLGQIVYCDRQKIWEDLVGPDQTINKYSKVCSRHFRTEDYKRNSRTARRRLSDTAVPSLHLPYDVCSEFYKFDPPFKPLGEVDVNDNNVEVRVPSQIAKKLETKKMSRTKVMEDASQLTQDCWATVDDNSFRRLTETAVPSPHIPFDDCSEFNGFNPPDKTLHHIDVNSKNAEVIEPSQQFEEPAVKPNAEERSEAKLMEYAGDQLLQVTCITVIHSAAVDKEEEYDEAEEDYDEAKEYDVKDTLTIDDEHKVEVVENKLMDMSEEDKHEVYLDMLFMHTTFELDKMSSSFPQ